MTLKLILSLILLQDTKSILFDYWATAALQKLHFVACEGISSNCDSLCLTGPEG